MGIYNEDFTFLIPAGYRCLGISLFSIPLGSFYHARTIIPRQNCPSANLVQNSIDPNNHSVI